MGPNLHRRLWKEKRRRRRRRRRENFFAFGGGDEERVENPGWEKEGKRIDKFALLARKKIRIPFPL